MFLRRMKIVKWAIIGLFLILALAGISKIYSLNAQLSPPRLPKVSLTENIVSLEQNWKTEDAHTFHHISQGTKTLPIPLSWFTALEQPTSSLFGLLIPFYSKNLLSDPEYMTRFGFIRSQKSPVNPHNLPIGFAATPFQNLNGLKYRTTAIGLTCAACHTGSYLYNDTEYVINGGSANIDLDIFGQTLGISLAQTLVTAKFPLPNRRFTRFAKKVLGNTYSTSTRKELESNLEKVVLEMLSMADQIDTTEGHARLDALNRIGNQVFAKNFDRPDNYAPINAPVNFPHIWTTSWFDWVQYDGSIMQPLIRNSGEALGVHANIDINAPKKKGRFSSSIPIENLYWLENFLSGNPPYNKKAFDGLLAPKWPESLPAINNELAQKGEEIYNKQCKGCHLPAIHDDAFWSTENFKKIRYKDKFGTPKTTEDYYLKLRIIALNKIGTDPAQANILAKRTVNTVKDKKSNHQAFGLDTQICTPLPNEGLAYRQIEDAPNLLFALALGATVQQVNDIWFKQNMTPSDKIPIMEGKRPNCLQVSGGYKARPLNGIWATAPYLHNGSVATLDDLLKPHNKRAKYIVLGPKEFDPVKVGLKQPEKVKVRKNKAYKHGWFVLDTSLRGNLNTGHEFSNDKKPGVIGPEFSDEERQALIEYLKTL